MASNNEIEKLDVFLALCSADAMFLEIACDAAKAADERLMLNSVMCKAIEMSDLVASTLQFGEEG